jgi:hypothetical protein
MYAFVFKLFTEILAGKKSDKLRLADVVRKFAPVLDISRLISTRLSVNNESREYMGKPRFLPYLFPDFSDALLPFSAVR